jgi:general secretion pathway protein G
MRVIERKHRRDGGFSLAELMVVVVIIGLLATLVMRNVMKNLADANLTKAKADIQTLAAACEEYAIDHGTRFPESLEELVTPNERGHRYLKQEVVPKDPWGNEYVYEPPNSASPDPLIYSLGKDGSRGGEGDDADISNKDILAGKR